jgi:hypothetical protein
VAGAGYRRLPLEDTDDWQLLGRVRLITALLRDGGL